MVREPNDDARALGETVPVRVPSGEPRARLGIIAVRGIRPAQAPDPPGGWAVGETTARPGHRDPHARVAEQPFSYPLTRPFVEPDWRRLPGFRDVTREEWESAQWQRAHTVKNLVEFKRVLGDLLTDDLLADLERDQQERATMSMLIPPQMINTMDERDLRADPVRRYMAPAFSERHPEWPSHPMSSRDSLHEAEMWAVEGLTHRYPTKVLAELIPTCPQYCGHCTRMDLVGNDTLQVLKYKFEMKQNDRWDAMLDYLRRTPVVRDVVVSGGDMANVPIKRLEDFVMSLLDIENVRDIRIATKGLMGIPQHFLQDEVREAAERMAAKAAARGVDIALHTHVNSAQQVTPLVGRAVHRGRDGQSRNQHYHTNCKPFEFHVISPARKVYPTAQCSHPHTNPRQNSPTGCRCGHDCLRSWPATLR